MLILAVNSLAVHGALALYVVSKSVLDTLYSGKSVFYPLSVLFEVRGGEARHRHADAHFRQCARPRPGAVRNDFGTEMLH